ncbi:MAG: DNA replication and repair protein RecF [Bacteroidota bacterium]|nr:DNA replication and repair protein RecF [Bacteroidota bacterium]
MLLKNLTLINFKNFDQLELELSPKINCFVGNNGVGKTNLLDALYYLSFCKSRFNAVDSQNIKHGQDFFVIQGEYLRKDEPEHIHCGLKKGQRKKFQRNKTDYNRLSEHIGFLPLVMKSPADINFIYDGSEERRKFIDGVISQFNHSYLSDLLHYNRTLSQRNKLLKGDQANPQQFTDTIEIYDNQLVLFGERIFKNRKHFTSELLPLFQDYYQRISQGNEEVHLEYQSQLFEASFDSLLGSSLDKDRILQYTTKGIHKDDIVLSIGNKSLKKFGSQGQQKTYLVALKFAQHDYIKTKTGLNPILLLDDIFDKLDRNRVKQIISLVTENHFGQIFISDTNKRRIFDLLRDSKIDYSIFEVEDGKLKIE